MIAIIDYGVGNLFSLRSSLTHLGLEAVVTADAQTIRKADRLILPGVGAFGDAMDKLSATGLVPVIREQAAQKPLLGICLGMQIAVIEYARHAAGITDADSGEFNELCENKVIDFMPGQSDEIDKGGTLRLGAYPCVIRPGTTMERCYGTSRISERHRHRYEENNDFREEIVARGLLPVGMSPDGSLVEMVENPACKWFVAAQFHPEFKSRPNKPHPLFNGFVKAALER